MGSRSILTGPGAGSEHARQVLGADGLRAGSVVESFVRWAAARPSAVAAQDGADYLTYGELARRAAVVAERLRRIGVEPGDRVALLHPRSLDALVAMVGVLYAGAVYVPLDPACPRQRLQRMAEDADVSVVIAPAEVTCGIKGLRAVMPQPPPSETVSRVEDVRTGGDDPACIMFTSGSTGRAKPVLVPHRAILRLVIDADYATFDPDDRVMAGAPLAFDASTFEIWAALLNGARAVLIGPETLLSPPALREFINSTGITVLFLATALFHQLARTHPGTLEGVGQVVVGGDRLDPDMCRRVLRTGAPGRLVNGYGPTENTVISTAYLIEDVPEGAASVPIGRAINGSSCVVLRSDGTVADVGETGELYVGGQGLALGYYGDPALTAEKFVRKTVDGHYPTLLYRTGDYVKVLPDGVLDFTGRRDRQVKIRGFRVELTEVEAALRAHPAVGEAVATAEADGGHKRLVAYVTPSHAGGTMPPGSDLRAEMAARLPDHLLPAAITVLDRLPLSPRGKLDTTRLPRRSTATDVPVPGEMAAIAALWSDVLKVPDVRPGDDFFALGGDSLLAAQVVLRAQAALGIPVEHASGLLRGMLDRPTLRGFSALAAEAGTRQDSPPAVDFDCETRLGLSCPGPPAAPPPDPGGPSHVLLTGATGFVGAYLLERLLTETRAHVHCAVRARDRVHARRRIRNNLRRFGLDTTRFPGARVSALPTNLADPRLGLSESAHTELAGCVDLIVHAAAHVNFLYPYESLKSANVTTTRRLIELAARRRVPIHYLSTIGVLAGIGSSGVQHITEDLPLPHPDRLSMGYLETKWVSERLLQRASESVGIPVSIHRPHEIAGALGTGAWNSATALPAMFKMIAETGLAPDIDLPLDLVPVDRLAAAVIHIATAPPAARLRVYHLANPRPALLTTMVDRIRHAGFDIRELPYGRWAEEFARFAERHPEHPFSPFLPLFPGYRGKTHPTVYDLHIRHAFPRFSRANSERALAGSTVAFPPVTDELLDLYLDYFHTSGFIRRPSG
nr:amino acid adenylation domain-containing protein [Amycolatopsis rubida]